MSSYVHAPGTHTVISAAAMTADISYANSTSVIIDLGEKRSNIGVHYKTATSGSVDHVGVLKFRLLNDLTNDTPQELSTTVSITAVAVMEGHVELADVCGRYFEVFYDFTSDGAADTLTVTCHVSQ